MSDLTPAAFPSRVLLSQTMPGRLAREVRLLADYANKVGIPVGFGSESMMERGRIAFDRSVLVAGSVRFVLHALRRLGHVWNRTSVSAFKLHDRKPKPSQHETGRGRENRTPGLCTPCSRSTRLNCAPKMVEREGFETSIAE